MSKKIIWIIFNISVMVIMLSISYIVMNFNSILVYSWQYFNIQEKKGEKNNLQEPKENDLLFLYNNSKEVKKNKENNQYYWEEFVKKSNLILDNLILIDKNINKAIEEKLKKKREELLAQKKEDIVFFDKSKSKKVEQDDFFSLSKPLTPEEEAKYWNKSYIIIPKLGIEAPIFYPDIETPNIEKHILDLLKDGVVHRPETQMPYQKGNFFILWHSSNYSWIKSNYNNIFAKIDFLNQGDEAYVIYQKRKYTYKLYNKKIVNADQLEVYWFIPGYNLSIMTCYPIGSTKQRLIALFSLEKNKD